MCMRIDILHHFLLEGFDQLIIATNSASANSAEGEENTEEWKIAQKRLAGSSGQLQAAAWGKLHDAPALHGHCLASLVHSPLFVDLPMTPRAMEEEEEEEEGGLGKIERHPENEQEVGWMAQEGRDEMDMEEGYEKVGWSERTKFQIRGLGKRPPVPSLPLPLPDQSQAGQ